MNRSNVVAVRSLVAVLLVVLVGVQVALPSAMTALAAEVPEIRPFVVPYAVAAVLAVAGVQGLLVVLAVAVGRVTRGRTLALTPRLDGAALAAVAVSTIAGAGLGLHVVLVARTGGPASLVGSAGIALVGTLAALVVLALREAPVGGSRSGRPRLATPGAVAAGGAR